MLFKTDTKLKNYLVVESIKFKSIAIFIAIVCFHSSLLAQNSSRGSIKTVVIDAGHGGKDPGTHGLFINEKTVVLAIALKFGEFIKEKYPNINLVYTRTTDTFITLGDRAEIANKNKADLFISIHANASKSSSPYGTETYALGLHRTEAQQRVAERENSPLLLEKNAEEKYKHFNLTPDAIIARQLQLSVYLQHSIDFAAKIENQFGALGRHGRGVKQAGFYVLYKTTMPSVLIEVGFLTNHKEEKFLASESGQLKMANSIFKAFQKYYAEIDGVNALVEDGHGYQASLEEIEGEEAVEEAIGDTYEANHVYFKVQILTSTEPLEKDDVRFKNITINRYQQNGIYKYTAGLFRDDIKSANQYKQEMRKIGFKDAFVVAFRNNKRISIPDARKYLKD